MTTVKEIEKAIAELPPQKISTLKTWFDKFEAARWDKTLEADARSGKLNAIASKVRESYTRGKSKEL